METIFALATAQGKSGVAVVRISGPSATAALRRLSDFPVPEPRRASVRRLHSADGGFLDEALVLTFEGGSSFTGEDVVELHLHGSIAVIRAVLSELADMSDLRCAAPGEFTRRALENGRLDLTQVEGLADLIEAETEAQRKQALRVLSGDLGARVREWRQDLVRAASLLEAVIDFADEEVPTDVTSEVDALLTRVRNGISDELTGMRRAERIRQGFEVAIIGAPNVGKSTLLNALAGREAAITSDVAGTTRDVIEVRMDLGGVPVTLLDTAGLRDTTDAVEAIGVKRARERAGTADLRVHLIASEAALPEGREEIDILRIAKDDAGAHRLGISGRTGFGIDRLIQEITERLGEMTLNASLVTRERHRTSLLEGRDALDAALDMVAQGPEFYDMTAEEIRTAARRMSALIGDMDVEALLDEIFSNFCLGK